MVFLMAVDGLAWVRYIWQQGRWAVIIERYMRIMMSYYPLLFTQSFVHCEPRLLSHPVLKPGSPCFLNSPTLGYRPLLLIGPPISGDHPPLYMSARLTHRGRSPSPGPPIPRATGLLDFRIGGCALPVQEGGTRDGPGSGGRLVWAGSMR